MDVPVWGVVITARCDTVHEKTLIVNYLPLVRLDDWLFRHGGRLIVDRALSEARNRFRTLLSQRGLSPSLLDVHRPADLVSVNFAAKAARQSSKDAKDAATAAQLADELDQLSNCLRDEAFDKLAITKALSTRQKLTQGMLKELFSHGLAGYYYVPSIGSLTEHASSHGYVALLREVHHIPTLSVRMLVNGVSRESGRATPTGLCLDTFDFSSPIAEIQSPWIEHLMQAFCNLFGRVGIADIDRTRVAQVVESIFPAE